MNRAIVIPIAVVTTGVRRGYVLRTKIRLQISIHLKSHRYDSQVTEELSLLSRACLVSHAILIPIATVLRTVKLRYADSSSTGTIKSTRFSGRAEESACVHRDRLPY